MSPDPQEFPFRGKGLTLSSRAGVDAGAAGSAPNPAGLLENDVFTQYWKMNVIAKQDRGHSRPRGHSALLPPARSLPI